MRSESHTRSFSHEFFSNRFHRFLSNKFHSNRFHRFLLNKFLSNRSLFNRFFSKKNLLKNFFFDKIVSYSKRFLSKQFLSNRFLLNRFLSFLLNRFLLYRFNFESPLIFENVCGKIWVKSPCVSRLNGDSSQKIVFCCKISFFFRITSETQKVTDWYRKKVIDREKSLWNSEWCAIRNGGPYGGAQEVYYILSWL